MALGSGSSSKLRVHVCTEASAGREGLHLRSAGVALGESKPQELTALAHSCRGGKRTSKRGRGINPCQVSRFPPDALGGVWKSPLSGPPLRTVTFGLPPPLGPHPRPRSRPSGPAQGTQRTALPHEPCGLVPTSPLGQGVVGEGRVETPQPQLSPSQASRLVVPWGALET